MYHFTTLQYHLDRALVELSGVYAELEEVPHIIRAKEYHQNAVKNIKAIKEEIAPLVEAEKAQIIGEALWS